jgi:hypothetical protein
MAVRSTINVRRCLIATMFAVFWVPALKAGCVLRFGGPHESAAPISFDEVSHGDFDALLGRYVDDRGQVCYSQWQEDCCDLNRLGAYLNRLTLVDPSLPATREATMAYYINAYNALTLWGILDSYPVVSIQRLDGERSRYAIFDDLRLWVGDRYLSVNGIENDVLRPMGDPRVHFALVCAARGCPRLRNRAYAAQCLHVQLDDNAIEFFSRHERFHISRLTGKVKVSPILKWYREDFGTTNHEVVSTVFRFLPAADRCWLAKHSCWKLKFLGYDWGLNDGCPTLSIAFGRMPYRAYSKVSPMIGPLMPQTEHAVANTTSSGTNLPASMWSPAEYKSVDSLEPPPTMGQLSTLEPLSTDEPPVPGDNTDGPVLSPLPIDLESPPIPFPSP